MIRTKRVVVIGGDGFIGRYVVRRLAAQGITIIVYARRARDALFLKIMGGAGQIVLAQGDIRDTARIAGVLAGGDAVVNLVGILRERGTQRFDTLQRDAAAAVALAAHRAGMTRLVQISAIGADPASASHYGRSKGEGEAAVRAAFPGATILRPSIVFGAEDRFLNRFAAMAKFSPILPIVGADTRFQPVYVDDVAAAVEAALDLPDTAGQSYELGGPAVYPFRALLGMMLRELGLRRAIVELPPVLARLVACSTAFLADPPLTMDQILLLRRDNVVAADALDLARLGIAATPLEAVLSHLLARFRSSA